MAVFFLFFFYFILNHGTYRKDHMLGFRPHNQQDYYLIYRMIFFRKKIHET